MKAALEGKASSPPEQGSLGNLSLPRGGLGSSRARNRNAGSRGSPFGTRTRFPSFRVDGSRKPISREAIHRWPPPGRASRMTMLLLRSPVECAMAPNHKNDCRSLHCQKWYSTTCYVKVPVSNPDRFSKGTRLPCRKNSILLIRRPERPYKMLEALEIYHHGDAPAKSETRGSKRKVAAWRDRTSRRNP
jgi:hypothetical protein